MRYEAILMDADQTLLDFETAEARALEKLCAAYGMPPAAAEDYRRVNHACWAAFERGEITQNELRRIRFEEFTPLYAPDTRARDMARVYEELLSQQSDILPGADAVARAIHEKLPIAIVTNGIACIQRPRMRESAVWPYVSHLVISEEVGASKPSPQMVWVALEKLGGVRPENALMIGDSLTSDMPAARDAGVDFLWYNPRGNARPANARIAFEARDIRDFIRISLQ